QHPHRESQSPAAREPAGKPRAPQPASRAEQEPPQGRLPKHAQHRPRLQRKTAGAEELLARGLEPPPIADAGRTDRLAAAAAETGVEMRDGSRVVGPQLAPLERAHEQNPPARTVGLVTGGEIGRTGRQAEPAMDARVERLV